MKKCPYCTTENRNQAIFCRSCKRPIVTQQTPQKDGSRNTLIWITVVFVLIGLGSVLFLPRSSLPASAALTPTSNVMPVTGAAPTHTQEPIVLRGCVRNTTRIRRGPGTHYETIGGLVSGTCLTILGRNEDASWVSMVSDDQQTGWVAASEIPDAGDIGRVSVRDHAAMTNPSRATLTSAEIANGAQAYLTQVSATNIPQAPITRHMTPCFGTADRIGDHISCRMERAYCDYLPAVAGSSTVCNDRPQPDHAFALIVVGEDWSQFDGQCLIVSGYLEVARGVLQIEALRRDQVSYCS